MDESMLTPHKIIPFTNGAPSVAQHRLADDATDIMCQKTNMPSEVEQNLRDGLASISVDNPWVVEWLRDFDPKREGLRQMLVTRIQNCLPYGQGLDAERIAKSVYALGSSIMMLSYMEELDAMAPLLWYSSTEAVSSDGESRGWDKVDPARILPVVLAHSFTIDRIFTQPTNPRQLIKDSQVVIEAVGDISYVESQWVEIQPILPELIQRRTLDQGVIAALLNEATTPMRIGAL